MKRAVLDRVDLIKIDVEGHELQVLRGLRGVIEQYRPHAIVFESDADLRMKDRVIGGFFGEVCYSLAGISKSLFGWRLRSLVELRRISRLCHDYVARPNADHFLG
jgi:hypothetical protein